MSNPKRSLFLSGQRYQAKKSFTGMFKNQFGDGKTYVFVSCKYSPYDACYVYEFRSEDDGTLVEWWLPEDSPVNAWEEYFLAL